MKMASSSVAAADSMSDIIELDIGGVHYKTSRQTLTKYPDSMLAAMFGDNSDKMPPGKRDDKGRYFIDRDGEMFTYILHYLRCGRLLLPESFTEYDRDRLMMEVDYYQIQPLIDSVREYREKEKGADVVLALHAGPYSRAGHPKIYRILGRNETLQLLGFAFFYGFTQHGDGFASGDIKGDMDLLDFTNVMAAIGYVCTVNNHVPSQKYSTFIKFNNAAEKLMIDGEVIKFL